MKRGLRLHFVLLVAAACGDGESGDMRMPPPMVEATRPNFELSAADPCAAKIPVPSDIFRADDLTSEASCAPANDPIEAAVQAALIDEGVALDAAIQIGASAELDAASLTTSIAWSLTSSASTSTTAGLPALLFIEQTGVSTSANGWTELARTVTYGSSTVRVTPDAPLENGSRYVVVMTDAILDSSGNELAAAPAVSLLTGTAPIAAGAYEGLDAGTAAKLERERQRLAAIVALLERGFPSIPRTSIVSIQTWRTALGPLRLSRVVKAYKDAFARGRFPYMVSTTGGDLDPTDVWPNAPPGALENVQAFREGAIKVPKLLDAQGRLRSGWATTDIQTEDVPFLISIPRTMRASYPVTLYLPGYGRSKQDARVLGRALGGGAQSAVMAIDMPGHGARSLEPGKDDGSNNNPEIAGPDGIPDRSGQGYLSGDARALRDGQIAAIIEVVHILDALRNERAFETQMINPDSSGIHLVAQGHHAQVALHAADISPFATLQFPSGGIGYEELVIEGPSALTDTFIASAPDGIDASNASQYLSRLEATVLQAVALDAAAARVAMRLLREPPRILLQHSATPEHTPLAARMNLTGILHMPASRISQHMGRCDDFYLHVCRLGDDFAAVTRAQDQIGTFVSSRGQTVLRPAM